jgi:hypothetical protein
MKDLLFRSMIFHCCKKHTTLKEKTKAEDITTGRNFFKYNFTHKKMPGTVAQACNPRYL